MQELDYTNRQVPADEAPDTVIKVWEVTPHMSDDYSHLVVRGWQDMLDAVRQVAEAHLENMPDDELRDGLEIKVRLVEMSRQEYDGFQDD